MKDSSLSEMVKSAVKVNLSYSATLLNLSKEYLRDFSAAVSQNKSSDQQESELAGQSTTESENTEKSDSSVTPRVPLILAGRAKEIANAAMMVNNTSGMSGTVSLEILGDFPGIKVDVEPKTLTMAKDESVIIRILANINSKLPVDLDFPGVVKISELDMPIAEFVVRRLPDLPKPKASSRKRNTQPLT